jgi:stage II sporulation protein Q
MIAEVMKMREEEKNRSSQSSSFKRFFKKRWVFPAIYIASAALILTGVLWYQSAGNSASDNYKSTDLAGKKYNQPSVAVNRAMENFVMPVKDSDQVVVEKKFYDFKASKDDQEAALVFYNNTYEPNTGIDYAMKNDETFDVVAALSGTVTRVDEDSLLGNVIEIEHDKGVVTLYESVKDMKVKVGDQVEQGQAIAMAGQSLLNEKAGTHVHFEIRKDGVAVNPENYFNKPLSELQDEKSTDNQADTEKASPKNDDSQLDVPKNNLDQSDDGASTPSDNSTDTTNNENS